MNNEEKILAMLEQMNSRQSRTETILEKMQSDIVELKQGQAKLETDIEDIKEDTGETRIVVNMLGKWAERVSPQVNIGLYDGD